MADGDLIWKGVHVWDDRSTGASHLLSAAMIGGARVFRECIWKEGRAMIDRPDEILYGTTRICTRTVADPTPENLLALHTDQP